MSYSQRKAFTLLELLVVIAILAILVAAAGFVMSGVMNRGRVQSTRVTLQNLRSMVSEFETVAKGLTRQPERAYRDNGDGSFTLLTTPPIDIWRDANPTDGPPSATNPEPDPFPAPAGTLRRDAVDSANKAISPRYREAVFNTQRVMGLLRSVPNNSRLLGQLPANQLMADDVSGTMLTTSGGVVADPPLVLDAWGNPIIFVPAAGLYGLRVGDVLRVRNPAAGALDGPIKSKDNRPFWASAGPDGNFEEGDDNLYSFEE